MTELCNYCEPSHQRTHLRGHRVSLRVGKSAFGNKFKDHRLFAIGKNSYGQSRLLGNVKINYCPMCGRKLKK